VQTQLEKMPPFELEFLQERINEAGSAAFDTFLADQVAPIKSS
jgi:hypothetical protein